MTCVRHPAPAPRRVELTLPAGGDSVSRVRHAVAALARACGAGEPVVADVALAVSEACTSVVATQPGAAARLHVTAEAAAGTLEVRVRRLGGAGRERDAQAAGLGLALMAAVATSVEVADEDDAAAVTLTFELRDAAPPER